MRLTLFCVLAALLVAASACGGDDSGNGDSAGDDTPPVETPAEEYIISGDCPPEPVPTGQPGDVVGGLLVAGFSPATNIDQAQAFLDMYVTDYRIGLFQYEDTRVVIICVEPGTENDVTKSLPLGGELRFVQRYRVGDIF